MDELSDIIDQGRIIARANDILTPELSAEIGAVHGTYLFLGKKGVLVAARDYSNNSRMLKRAYISGSMSTGVNILNLHSAPMPVVQFCIRRFGAKGGVYFSSGHTYSGETAIRFYDSSGIEYSSNKMDIIASNFKESKINRVEHEEIGTLTSILQTFEIYKKVMPQFVDKQIISKKRLKVVIDCSFGPTSELAPEILNSINANVIALNTYYRPLSNKIYPDLDSVRDTASIVKASEADVGVILDFDGSRLLIIDETGNLVDFEDLFMLFISNDKDILKNNKNPIITTTSCSKIIDSYAENLGFIVKRVENLPGAISRTVREERASFGGSDTFKFYFSQYGPFSDGIFILLKLLEILANKSELLSSMLRNFPKTIKVYKTLNVDKNLLDNFVKIIKENMKNEDVFLIDTILGVKIVFEKFTWVKLIPSIHRDSIIFSSEAPSTRISEKLIKQIEEMLLEFG
ncbi:MAG: hypothetical protein GY870_08560 [archaeon]|nr:hypothetical protein [archaeon]